MTIAKRLVVGWWLLALLLPAWLGVPAPAWELEAAAWRCSRAGTQVRYERGAGQQARG